ncbi:bZIP transcription factor [Colletotrichum karsti]|uniref:BZIP transcription factor n=1 Tax=Colletotrichum karsti TaxID=1095194 RepID=A0A9P6HWY9_9PEZI|nr:bZIP transcription factor [Colletotrichum karsti]KAF9872373.1 bZIP transcription factor [Colletotrichum karsti]
MASTPGTAPTPDARTSTTTTTATGTVSSSRLKKREADRKAQRIAREKTKNRIAHLESLVAELSRKDDNATTVALMTQLSRVTEQRNKLVSCLETTSGMFSKNLEEVRESEEKSGAAGREGVEEAKAAVLLDAGLDFLAPPPPAVGPTEEKIASELETRSSDHDVDCLMNGTALDASDLWIDGVFPQTMPSPPPPPIPVPTTKPPQSTHDPSKHPPSSPKTIKSQHCKQTCSCASTTRTRRLSDGSLVSHNCWNAGNEILKEPFPLTEAMLRLEYQVSEDVPVHAVLHGWDSLAHSGRMTPLWRKVRQLDELCFNGCGPAERLAVLFMIHLLMRAYTDPTPVKSAVVPQWYLKTQLQQISPGHDPSADYFTWPALRYRFATTPHRYCDNTFWHMFREHLRITWPFDFRDCYVRNVHLGAYGLSPLFKDRLRDLRAWTMEPDFFAQYPELRQDVPQFPGHPSPAVSMSSPRQDATGALTDAVLNGESVMGTAEERGEEGEEESEGELFLGDLGIETGSDFLFFQEALCNAANPQESGTRLSKHKDSSCISL